MSFPKKNRPTGRSRVKAGSSLGALPCGRHAIGHGEFNQSAAFNVATTILAALGQKRDAMRFVILEDISI